MKSLRLSVFLRAEDIALLNRYQELEPMLLDKSNISSAVRCAVEKASQSRAEDWKRASLHRFNLDFDGLEAKTVCLILDRDCFESAKQSMCSALGLSRPRSSAVIKYCLRCALLGLGEPSAEEIPGQPPAAVQPDLLGALKQLRTESESLTKKLTQLINSLEGDENEGD